MDTNVQLVLSARWMRLVSRCAAAATDVLMSFHLCVELMEGLMPATALCVSRHAGRTVTSPSCFVETVHPVSANTRPDDTV